jgi:septal ring factor EnvC (AmiA/AmiB activator)
LLSLPELWNLDGVKMHNGRALCSWCCARADAEAAYAPQEAGADTAQWRHELLVQQQYTAQLEATLAAASRSHQAEAANHDLQSLQEDVQHLQMRITLLQQENADLKDLLHQ